MASSTCSSRQLLARVRRLNKTHACNESQLRLAGCLTAILNHLARQALMHACAVGFIMQRQIARMAEGAGTVASTLFSSHLPQVDCSRARCPCHDGVLTVDVYCDNMQTVDLPICLGLGQVERQFAAIAQPLPRPGFLDAACLENVPGGG